MINEALRTTLIEHTFTETFTSLHSHECIIVFIDHSVGYQVVHLDCDKCDVHLVILNIKVVRLNNTCVRDNYLERLSLE